MKNTKFVGLNQTKLSSLSQKDREVIKSGGNIFGLLMTSDGDRS